ncbi:MAG: glycosyltransferase family 2 protein [Acidobacteria bacterium]|nr:glycosyltransferase family 2 protein [Acidobacteriota bacterium]
MYKGSRITVVIPCLNEEDGIQQVLMELPSLVDEVIVVDNNSTDRTAEVSRGMGAFVVREIHRGYGRAYKKGFSHATGDIIVTLDGDHSYPVDALSYLLEAFLHSRVGFLSASRFPLLDPYSMSFKHRFGNFVLSVTMSLLFFQWVSDSQTGMWVFNRNVLDKMTLRSDGMAFSEEIKIEAIRNRSIGFREIFINYSNRIGEKKLQPWKDGIRNIAFLFRKRFAP